MADPGDAGGPFIFRPKWGPKGRKNVGTQPPPPPAKNLGPRASPLSQGLDSALLDVMFRVCVYVT